MTLKTLLDKALDVFTYVLIRLFIIFMVLMVLGTAFAFYMHLRNYCGG